MATDCIAQVTFQGEGFAKPVVARFDLPDASSDGGLVLFKALCARSSRSAADQSMCWHCGACSWLLQDVWVQRDRAAHWRRRLWWSSESS